MKFRPDYILLCILWLLAITLVTCFWFNISFGFNIFSAAHWEYLAYLQAGQSPIKIGFYISIVVIVFVTILGLYAIVRPRIRKIRMPIMHVSDKNKKAKATKTTTNDIQNTDASTLDIMPAQPQESSTTQNTTSPSPSMRPPRLNIPSGIMQSGQRYVPENTHSTPSPTPPAQQDWPEIREIFTSFGYTVKTSPKINGINIALLAIGTNETLWIGGIGIKTTEMRTVIDKLDGIFSDTLDNNDIIINGFVISAPDAATSEFQDILMFNTIAQLREYMSQHPNPPLPNDDNGLFDAYSQYIDAVINHIGIR